VEGVQVIEVIEVIEVVVVANEVNEVVGVAVKVVLHLEDVVGEKTGAEEQEGALAVVVVGLHKQLM
jgi:hypothetical protein